MSTPETEEIRKAIFVRINDSIEDRPFDTRDERDGNWKYVHHLRAKSAVLSQIPAIQKLERERDELRANLKLANSLLSDYSDTRAAFSQQIAMLEEERAELRSTLRFVERMANHHGQKPHMTAEETLSWIQHHPGVTAITESYSDGKIPETPNPWKERDELRAKLQYVTGQLIEAGCDDGAAPIEELARRAKKDIAGLRAEVERLKTSHAIELQSQMEENNNEVERLKADKARLARGIEAFRDFGAAKGGTHYKVMIAEYDAAKKGDK